MSPGLVQPTMKGAKDLDDILRDPDEGPARFRGYLKDLESDQEKALQVYGKGPDSPLAGLCWLNFDPQNEFLRVKLTERIVKLANENFDIAVILVSIYMKAYKMESPEYESLSGSSETKEIFREMLSKII